MPDYDFTATRLHLVDDLSPDTVVTPDRAQQHYLNTVLRLGPGSRIAVFNGRDGEFEARLDGTAKRPTLVIGRQLRGQPPASRLRWLFAPLKHARLDYMVQKAVEMGVGSIEPVITRRTQVSRVNLERMKANAIEAAEQCGVLGVPRVEPERRLSEVIATWPADLPLIFCDEAAGEGGTIAALEACAGRDLALIIGPEGGFDETERAALLALPHTVRLSLGPRILRADTAAVAALAIIQAVAGDWEQREPGGTR